MNTLYSNHVVWLFLVMLCLLSGCENQGLPKTEPSGKTVKVGVIAPMSGDDEAFGRNGMAGVELALQIQPYLLNGDKIDIVLVDDTSDVEMTVAAAEKLVLEEKVAAMLVISRSASALALSEVADNLKTPFLSLLSSHPSVTKNNWGSQLMFDDVSQGIISALYVRDELLIDNVTVFRQADDPHSVFLVDTFVMKFQESGGKAQIINIGPDGVASEDILNDLDPQYQNFFYLPIDATYVLEIEKETRRLGLQPQMMVSDGIVGNVILEFEDDVRLLDGMMAVDVYSTGVKKTKYGRLLSERFLKNFEEPGTTLTVLGCEGTAYLLAAMQKCDDPTDKVCINKKLRSREDFVGYSSVFRIGSKGKVERPVFINLVQNAKLDTLVKIY